MSTLRILPKTAADCQASLTQLDNIGTRKSIDSKELRAEQPQDGNHVNISFIQLTEKGKQMSWRESSDILWLHKYSEQHTRFKLK